MFDVMQPCATKSPWGDLTEEDFETMVAAATAAAMAMPDVPDTALPSGIGEMEPGPMLAAALSTIDLDQLCGHDRVVVLQAHARMEAHSRAQVYAAMASITQCMKDLYDDPITGAQSAAAEIGLALTLTRRSAENELALGLDLRERLPEVWERFARGEIDQRRARTIAHGTDHLPVAAARNVTAQILERAGGMTTGQIAAELRRLCLQSDPEDAVRRYDDAVSERCIIVEQNPSGTGNLHAFDVPADRLAAIRQHIHDIAKGLRTAGETRTMDQLRTDVFLDLLDGSANSMGRSQGVIDLHVDLATLAELADAPGEVAGFGPVIADVARQIVADAADAQWRWSATDEHGRLVANGTTTRRPAAAVRRHIQSRHRTCIFPGCRMPATRSDIDHRIPWSESHRTRTRDLAPLCRHHHTVRHLPGWSYRLDTDGTISWTTPLRHTHTRRGPP